MKKLLVLLPLLLLNTANAHEHSIHHYHVGRAIAFVSAALTAESPKANKNRTFCKLTIDAYDKKTGKSLPALIRATNPATKKHVVLKGPIKRDANWFTIPHKGTVSVPREKITIEVINGLETETAKLHLDLTNKTKHAVRVGLNRFYNAGASGLTSGNTHLHLMRLTHREAVQYLQQVPQSDDLDILFVSVLRRIPDERTYITNKFTAADLQRIAPKGVLLGNGEEHRHNFKGYGEGYGHVMLLNLIKLIRPVSIGPGIMRSGYDGIPLTRGIQTARKDGATIIWCHNSYGMEDLPNFAMNRVHAQNIFDGSRTGSYNDSFYRYLDVGMKVPFSTGTDWFIYDFSRVYCPSKDVSINGWLNTLRKGKSYITNGPFLDFRVNGKEIGDTIDLSGPTKLTIQGQGLGRMNFRQLEVVHNGRVIQRIDAKKNGGHFAATLKSSVKVDKPGWLALRIPLMNNKNVFGKVLYAHTSPIYIRVRGKDRFRHAEAQRMILEMTKSTAVIKQKGKFKKDAGLKSVLKVYEQGIAAMRKRIEAAK